MYYTKIGQSHADRATPGARRNRLVRVPNAPIVAEVPGISMGTKYLFA